MPSLRSSEHSLDWISQARARLARRRTEKPTTKAGQVWALWPDIEAAIAGGQSMKTIRNWLQEEAGITLGITSLTSYISRIRRRIAAKGRTQTTARQVAEPQAQSVACERLSAVTRVTQRQLPPSDPLAQAKRVLSQPRLDIRQLHNDGDPEGSNLI